MLFTVTVTDAFLSLFPVPSSPLPPHHFITILNLCLHPPSWGFQTYLFLYTDEFLVLGFKPKLSCLPNFTAKQISCISGSRTSNPPTTYIFDTLLKPFILNSLPAFISSDWCNPIITYDLL